MIAQLKLSLLRRGQVIMKRYILEDHTRGLENLEQKFMTTTDCFDEYGTIKMAHQGAMDLYIVKNDEIPQAVRDEPVRSVLLLRLLNSQDRIWIFTFDPRAFKHRFVEITSNNDKQRYRGIVATIEGIPVNNLVKIT
jgi:hypothetical protein